MSLFLFIYCITHTEMHSFIHTFITFAETCSRFPHRLSLSRGISIGVPGRDLNLGLPYSRPTKYCRSYAAPKSELCHILSELRRTQIWATQHPIWSTPHPIWSMPHPIWATPHPIWATQHPIWSMPHPIWSTPHPIRATQHPSPSYAVPCLSYIAPNLSYAASCLSYASPKSELCRTL